MKKITESLSFVFRGKHLSAALCLALVLGCSKDSDSERNSAPGYKELARHSEEFKRAVITVTEGVHVLVGYGLANVIVLEGYGGYVLVDTMESVEAARRVKKDVDALVKGKPLRAVIYTHNHSDHTFGTSVFTGGTRTDIFAHESTAREIDRIAAITRETTFRRAMRQFGVMIPKKDFLNSGIGPFLDFGGESEIGLERPTRVLAGKRSDLVLAGIRIVAIHSPGETDDQIILWLPDKKVLLPADNYYHSFPNLYAIRGTSHRDTMKWVESLDEMRGLGAAFMVPSHTRPVIGAEEIERRLTDYRDAIQYVHDQTVRLMNLGLTQQEIVEKVRLPKYLAEKPWLAEYYGTVAWSVRAVFNGYVGWFGGNATDLFPLGQKERARRMAELAGGEDSLADRAQQAFEKGDYQWSLELTDHLLALDPDDSSAKELRSRSLARLGDRQSAATARNYYLTSAAEASGKLVIRDRKIREKDILNGVPLEAIFRGMSVRFNPEKAGDVSKAVAFYFTDTGEKWTVTVRHGIAEVRPRSDSRAEITLKVNSKTWKEIAAGLRSPTLAYASGDVQVEGGTFDLVRFLSYFR